MRIFAIVIAILIILFGLRLLFRGLQAIIMMFKAGPVSTQTRQTIFRDIVLGFLFLILAIAMLT